ncbi:MAG TPA: hypothetical protein VHO95_07960, partial [Candidatus Dormibacteraeota bacterium]|nr:hypothetical protein [Candidatus Dormibacteraeota bacterium]
MKDSLHEALIYAFSHPLALAFAETTRRMGDVVDVPFVGRVVSDPEIAREILLDSKHFNKSGPGSFGAVITQVMGDYALLNMDGEPHLRLRGRLHDLFAPAYLDTVDQEVLSAPIDEFCYRLAAGETLDVVRFAQLLTGRTTWHMLGMTAPESDAEARYLELFELTRRLTASIRLSTRRLSADKAVLKRTTFARLTAPIAEAYTSGKFPDRSVIARL